MTFVNTIDTEEVSMPDCVASHATAAGPCGNAPLLQSWQECTGTERRIINGTRSTRGWTAIFVYLQLLDLLTTLVGFKLGAQEGSPFVRLLIHAGAVEGVVMAKLVALTFGAFCIRSRKMRVLKWIVYWSGALVVWNLLVILASA
jgi:hypothetical protein